MPLKMGKETWRTTRTIFLAMVLWTWGNFKLMYVNTLYIWRLLSELAWPSGKLPYQLLE